MQQRPGEKSPAGCAPGETISVPIVAALVVAQFFFGAWSVVSRSWVVGGEGINFEVFLFYRFLIGAVFLTILARAWEGMGPGPPVKVSPKELAALAAVFCLSNWAFLGSVGRVGSFLPALGETLIPVYV